MYLRLAPAFLAVVLLVPPGCQQEIGDPGMAVTILSPGEGSMLFPGETVRVRVRISSDLGYDYMEAFLDGNPAGESAGNELDIKPGNSGFPEGSHQILIRAFDIEHNMDEAFLTITVVSATKESLPLESFESGLGERWFLSGWSGGTGEGYDDNYSLQSTKEEAYAITRRQYQGPGSISFHVKNGSGYLEFQVDGLTKAKWFGKGAWGQYAYTITEGDHIFKWTGSSEGVLIDRVEFTEGIQLHTPGEYFGGGIVYFVDSTGQHGLIASYGDGQYDGKYAIPWGCYGVPITTGNRAESPTDGRGNTLAIIKTCTEPRIAARYCYDYAETEDSVVFEDWYLPAKVELDHLHTNKEIFDNLFGQYYWSSTNKSDTGASVINFEDGSHHGAHKSIPNVLGPVTARIYTRPVRRF